jgi:hypothetical protein
MDLERYEGKIFDGDVRTSDHAHDDDASQIELKVIQWPPSRLKDRSCYSRGLMVCIAAYRFKNSSPSFFNMSLSHVRTTPFHQIP